MVQVNEAGQMWVLEAHGALPFPGTMCGQSAGGEMGAGHHGHQS